jgi:hypothetical protein
VWNVDPLGYQPDHPILEVLVAAGAVWEPGGWWTVASQDPNSDYYVVTFTSEDASEGGAVNETIAAWTDVPRNIEVHSRTSRTPASIPSTEEE